MNRRILRQRAGKGLAVLALGVTGLVAGPAGQAHASGCLAVEVSSSAGDFCVIPTPLPGTSAPASGPTTVTNHLLVPVRAVSDTGDSQLVSADASVDLVGALQVRIHL